ncbi:MAG: glycoside hydrolase family 5 protein [Geminicoccaceae bacterium]
MSRVKMRPLGRSLVALAAGIFAGLLLLASPASALNELPSGYLKTNKSNIVDANGREIRILGVNWFGFETPNMVVHGLWARPFRLMMDQMSSLGFNTIRLPFSSAILTAGPESVSAILYRLNPDLQGKSPMEILDMIIAYAGTKGLKVILDNHSLQPTTNGESNGYWYSSTRSEAQWIADWQTLARRYANNPTVIGADLYNEPTGTWGTGDQDDWARAAKAAGDAIGAVNKNWLIIVEGLRFYRDNYYWWGGELEGVKDYPIQLALSNKLVYSTHDYPNSLWTQPWFSDPTYPANMPAVWDKYWGFIETKNIAPVLIGEFGSRLETTSDRQWADAMSLYLAQRKVDWVWFSWNANGEPRGILSEDWETPNPTRLAHLQGLINLTRR